MDRRGFVKNTGLLAMMFNLPIDKQTEPFMKTIRVVHTGAEFEREKLNGPFGFKGGYLSELWQAVSKLKSASGESAIGIATQSILYADADLFVDNTETGGNALMFVLVNEALKLVKETPFQHPVELMEKIMPALQKAAVRVTGKKDLNQNFIYNALVSIDNAAWLLYAKENGFTSFDAMVPTPYRRALQHHNKRIAIMYQVPYDMPMSNLVNAMKEGYFVIKIKTGFPGSQEVMLERDMERLTQIHQTLKDYRTPHTPNGKLIYTMDANGRYEKKSLLIKYLDHAKKIGAFDQVLVYEEPFVESNNEHVGDLGIRIAADESVHVVADAEKRIAQGYSALVLKGIAKTLSQSMKIATFAQEKNIPCLCADLTVNPVLVEWHKNLAARIAPFPVIGMGLMETNGDLNYENWEKMIAYQQLAGASWMQRKKGIFELDEDFYNTSGGIFGVPRHYEEMFIS
ncbi:L-alanine-DL-glutamate epimerase [Chitinophaga sp. SYP-B3965]|uniref:enolase C-terminal domain-like protein n=1 Tax=Chitinophaga sp. SYP-B3965 TaxID=2663120 RepID=UPI001299E25F|nr:enolase C-terminal domain-like protein [Chitinophaga sp. SYP-B3965]MRG48347.1 L-alanine-DL-glutamate epimerase [Chitinophaga sp. SYP-B3965]